MAAPIRRSSATCLGGGLASREADRGDRQGPGGHRVVPASMDGPGQRRTDVPSRQLHRERHSATCTPAHSCPPSLSHLGKSLWGHRRGESAVCPNSDEPRRVRRGRGSMAKVNLGGMTLPCRSCATDKHLRASRPAHCHRHERKSHPPTGLTVMHAEMRTSRNKVGPVPSGPRSFACLSHRGDVRELETESGGNDQSSTDAITAGRLPPPCGDMTQEKRNDAPTHGTRARRL